jgi:hypothetical protein
MTGLLTVCLLQGELRQEVSGTALPYAASSGHGEITLVSLDEFIEVFCLL